jgi:hypothetical protein
MFIIMRLLAFGLMMGVVACRGDRPLVRKVSQASAIAASTRGAASLDSAFANRWLASADSAVAGYLSHLTFGHAPADSAFGNCDTGADENSLLLVAIGRYRILERSAIHVDSFPDFGVGPMKQSGYRLELTSVAHFIPTWTIGPNSTLLGEAPVPPTHGDAEPYVVSVGLRLDTVSVVIGETRDNVSQWYVCNLIHEGDEYTPFWDFISRPDSLVAPVKWAPATASWKQIAHLADSVASAHRQ